MMLGRESRLAARHGSSATRQSSQPDQRDMVLIMKCEFYFPPARRQPNCWKTDHARRSRPPVFVAAPNFRARRSGINLLNQRCCERRTDQATDHRNPGGDAHRPLLLGRLVGERVILFQTYFSLIWPPAGIALAAILLFGYRYWLGVAVGALLFAAMDGEPVWLLHRGHRHRQHHGRRHLRLSAGAPCQIRPRHGTCRDGAGFTLLACGLGTSINALFNVFSLIYDQPFHQEDVFPGRGAWVPNALAALVITPVVITWAVPTHVRLTRWRALEAIICTAGLVSGTLIAFETWFAYGPEQYPLAYLPYPFLAWSALRFGPRGATASTFLVTALAIHSLLMGRGPFYIDTGNQTKDLDYSLRLLGCYIGVMAVSNLLLASASTERRRAMADVIANEKRLRTVMADQTDLICRFNPTAPSPLPIPPIALSRPDRGELLHQNFYKLLSRGDTQIAAAPCLSRAKSRT